MGMLLLRIHAIMLTRSTDRDRRACIIDGSVNSLCDVEEFLPDWAM